jgi:hypothetical protein
MKLDLRRLESIQIKTMFAIVAIGAMTALASHRLPNASPITPMESIGDGMALGIGIAGLIRRPPTSAQGPAVPGKV